MGSAQSSNREISEEDRDREIHRAKVIPVVKSRLREEGFNDQDFARFIQEFDCDSMGGFGKLDVWRDGECITYDVSAYTFEGDISVKVRALPNRAKVISVVKSRLREEGFSDQDFANFIQKFDCDSMGSFGELDVWRDGECTTYHVYVNTFTDDISVRVEAIPKPSDKASRLAVAGGKKSGTMTSPAMLAAIAGANASATNTSQRKG